MALDLTAVADTALVASSHALTRATNNLARYAPGHTVAYITREEGPAPAWYHQKTGEIVLSLRFADDEPDARLALILNRIAEEKHAIHRHLDLPLGREGETYGTLFGIFQHEVAHSRWSRWQFEGHDEIRSLTDRPNAVTGVLRLWEEIRIEKRAYDREPLVRVPFRHSFAYLLKKLTEDTPVTKAQVAHLWALTVGRVFASIVETDEVLPINDLACTIIGDDDVVVLREILDQAVVWDEHTARDDLQSIVSLAEEWLDVLGIDEDGDIKIPDLLDGEDADADGDIHADAEFGEEGDHATRGSEEPWAEVTEEESKRLLEAIEKAGDFVRKNAGRVSLKLSDPRQKADEVFGKRFSHTGVQWDVRPPSHSERTAVTTLAAAFTRINYQAPAVTKVATAIPPGRIRSRDAVRRSAERAGGRMVTAQPWERKKRRHVHNPPLTLGLMTDTSGSMGWAQEVVASAAYIFSNAIARVGGKAAAVTFGDYAEGVVRPGEVPTTVASRRANGGTERFEWAIAALDGALHLTHNKGAKVVVIICDGGLVETGECERAVLWLERLRRAGTAVLWLDSSVTRNKEWLPSWVELQKIPHGTDFTKAVDVIADSMERAFRAAQGGVTL
jgi:hypothetical protein